MFTEIPNKLTKIKNTPACTHLSKLNNSNQVTLGINLPGIEHNPKITSAQAIANL